MRWCESYQGFTIVTASSLLAGVAAQQFSRHQLSRGVESWERPAIYSLNAWLAACWQEARYRGAERRTLLSSPQERVLWERIVEQHHPHLFDSRATAVLAQRSASLVAEWHIPLQSNHWSDNSDSEQFQIWYRAFRARLRDECCITRSDLWSLLPEWIHANYIEPGQVVFAGFAATTPALEQLKQALGERAIDEPLNATREFGDIQARSCADLGKELEQAARWARTTFERQPSRSIGVFVPDLASRRQVVQRTFERVFYPGSALRGPSSAAVPFHIASKAPLAEHPLIASALLLLKTVESRSQSR